MELMDPKQPPVSLFYLFLESKNSFPVGYCEILTGIRSLATSKLSNGLFWNVLSCISLKRYPKPARITHKRLHRIKSSFLTNTWSKDTKIEWFWENKIKWRYKVFSKDDHVCCPTKGFPLKPSLIWSWWTRNNRRFLYSIFSWSQKILSRWGTAKSWLAL